MPCKTTLPNSILLHFFERSDKVHTLEELQPGIKLDKKSVHIDPNILFTRLTSILGTVDNISEYFEYELTPEPTSLFKDSMMRKSTKSTLRNKLMDQVEPSDEVDVNVCVIDGGSLLHKVYWPPNSTYGDVFHQYTQYIQRRYRNYQSINVVFDGYADKSSTKTHEQIRRGSTLAANIEIYKDAKVTASREAFLRNPRNKEQFIKILSDDLSVIGCHIHQAVSDADILIVSRALELASENNVVVFADDTDIFVLLCYVGTERSSKDKNGKSLQYWNINDVVDQLEKRKLLLFSHAWSGCDTTSAMFQQGKLKILKMLQCDENKALANKFGNLETSQDDVANAGCRLLLKNLGGKPLDTLGKLCYTKYMQMISSSTLLQPERLPPTTNAIRFHSLRVHLQVSQWKYLDINVLDVIDWGWKSENSYIIPVKTDIDPAPEWLLNVVRCKCKVESRNPCGTQLCSCRKNGIKCVVACGDCRGELCNNAKCEQDTYSSNEEDKIVEDDFDRNIFDLF